MFHHQLKISISESSFPSLTLLFNKLLKFEGFIIIDNLFSCLISNSFKMRVVFLIIGSDLSKDKKSTNTFIFSTGIKTPL